MDAPFDLVLTLIPIALLIGVQIFASRKKKAEEAERAKLATFLAQAVSAESGPAKPREAEFDAFSLAPDDDDDFKTAARSFGRTAAPRVDGGPYRPSASPATSAVPSNVPSRLVSDVPTDIVESVLSDSKAASVGDRPGVTGARTADRFFARLEKLSPLKRAIVMSEVLGKPKGL